MTTNRQQLVDILHAGIARISDIKPSAYAEQNIIMPEPRPGPLSYLETMYNKEIIDCFAPDHPMRTGAYMKGSQVGGSASILIPFLIWMIENAPGNTYFNVGTPQLVAKVVLKFDKFMKAAGKKHLLGDQGGRIRNQKSGDTNLMKEFLDGYIFFDSPNNPKSVAQESLKYVLLDDADAIPSESAEGGDLIDLFERRCTAYPNSYKMFLISTPLLKEQSQIEKAYLMGDQRAWFIECPHCNEAIIWKWSVDEGDVINPLTGQVAKCKGGFNWGYLKSGLLDKSTVGYECYLCGGKHNDKNKDYMLQGGLWVPRAHTQKESHYSWHLPSLYCPTWMFGWDYYIQKYIEANPPGQVRKEKSWQTFVNTALGETYAGTGMSPEAKLIRNNTRDYEIGIVPNSLSISDGNGPIVMLTMSADMNGTVAGRNNAVYDDARIDWEILAHAASGATYSVAHGSVGTFVPLEGKLKEEVNRDRWSYQMNVGNSVWPELDKIIGTRYRKDDSGEMPVVICGLDIGAYTDLGVAFLDWTNNNVIGLKGDKEYEFMKEGAGAARYKPMGERKDGWMVGVGYIKDDLANYMMLRWDGKGAQPPNFMNYPTPEGGLYTEKKFFAHYEAEHRAPVKNKDGRPMFKWVKNNSASQNHFFDCFDEMTEVLTDAGWMPFKDITEQSKLATVNLITDNLEYQKPQTIIKRQHDGNMVHMKGRRLDIMVTENHRMVTYRKKWNRKTNSGRMLSDTEIVLAKDLRATDTIKVSSGWDVKGNEFYYIPEMRDSLNRIIAEKKAIPAKVWAAFLGMYISEGSKAENWNEKRGSYAYKVQVHQNEGVKYDQMKTIFDQLPFKYKSYITKGIGRVFVVTQKQLYHDLYFRGENCYTKNVGTWIKKQSKEVISEFLKYAILGDGNIGSTGHKKYYTTSKVLSDEIQELFIKAGYQSNIYELQPKDCKINGINNPGNTVLQYHISGNKSGKASLRDRNNNPIFRNVPYSGMVYCATVPNGTLICRRNGKSFVAGNCRVYNLALRDIFVMILHKMMVAPHKPVVFGWREYVAMVTG